MKKASTIFLLVVVAMLFSTSLLGAEEITQTAAELKKWLGFSAAFAIGIAAMGGALAQGRAAAAALGGISRNPGAKSAVFTPMILGLALIESLVIYALIIAFMLVGKI